MRIAAREPVVTEGEVGHAMYVILAGRVEVSRLSEIGTRVHFHELGRGEFFGEMSLLTGAPRSADVSTTEASEFLVVDREAFVRTVLDSPDLALKIIAHLCTRLRQSDEARTSRRPVRQRLILALLELAEAPTPSPRGLRQGPVVIMSRQHLADRISARRETVSRELAHLAADNYLRVVGKQIILCKPDKLRALCD
jgi:CRP-like cAMP-binding protein